MTNSHPLCLACLPTHEGGEDLLGYPGPEHHTACVYYRANRPGPASTPPARRRTPVGENSRFVDRLTDVSDKAGRYAVKTPVPEADGSRAGASRAERDAWIADQRRGIALEFGLPSTPDLWTQDDEDACVGETLPNTPPPVFSGIEPSQARARSAMALQRLANALGLTIRAEEEDCLILERLALQAERWRKFDQLVDLANSTRTKS